MIEEAAGGWGGVGWGGGVLKVKGLGSTASLSQSSDRSEKSGKAEGIKSVIGS